MGFRSILSSGFTCLWVEIFGLLIFWVLHDGVLEHGLTVTTGIKAAQEATEEREAQVDPDVIVERFVAGRMVITKWAKPGIYQG